MSYSFDIHDIIVRIAKYIFEGLVVAIAAYYLPGKKSNAVDVLTIGLVASATFSLLDLMSNGMGATARQGAGLAIGANLGGFGGGGIRV